MKEKISITIDNSMLKEIDNIIDNILIRNRSQAIEYLINLALGDNKTAVILCGGAEENLKNRIRVPSHCDDWQKIADRGCNREIKKFRI
jgi:hypothetical protein